MAVAVHLDLGGPDAEAVLALVRRLEAYSPTAITPLRSKAGLHLALAVWESADPAGLDEAVSGFVRDIVFPDIALTAVGVFPLERPILYLAPRVDRRLLALHADLRERLAPVSEPGWPSYRAAAWIPHVTLCDALTREALPGAVAIAAEAALPLRLTVERLGVSSFPPVRRLAEHAVRSDEAAR